MNDMPLVIVNDRADSEPIAHAILAHTAQEAAATAGSDLTSGHSV
jgi:hypothetical protein